jgi:hypothetical protein
MSSHIEKIKKWIWRTFDESISLNIVRDLPDVAMYSFGLLFNITFTTLMIYFISSGYETSITSAYLVPVENADPGICENVPRALPNGQYYFDTEGRWSGLSTFDYSKAAYSFTFNNFAVPQVEYVSFMTGSEAIIKSIGEAAVHRPLTDNLLYWMIWKASVPLAVAGESFEQVLNFVGAPLTVFRTDLVYGTIRNVNFDCNISQSTHFDATSGFLKLSMSTAEYKDSVQCSSVVSPATLIPSFYQNTYGISPSQIYISADIRTIMMSVAVSVTSK